MRLLLINYRYFVSGGPERYMFNVKSLLEEHGHEVIPFSISYDQNEPSEYADYFAPPISGSAQVYFRDQSRSVRGYMRSVERSFYSPTVYRRLAALIDATKPDAALVLHYLRKLSPSVLKCLADKRVPFAVRLSDFAMICPNAHLLRDSRPCELCVSGSLRHSVRHACVQGSAAVSAVNYLATRFHRAAGYYELIPRFVAPSRFMISKMVDGGWNRDLFAHVPTFVHSAPGPTSGAKDDVPLIAYAGRLERTKGVETLLGAAGVLERDPSLGPFRLLIAGDGEASYVARLHQLVADRRLDSARFIGPQDSAGVATLLRRAWCSVVPSLWYENTPHAALESMAQATAVVAADHGSLPEIVSHGATGWLTPPGDATELARALKRMILGRDLVDRMGSAASHFVRREHSADTHYARLIGVFASLTVNSGGRSDGRIGHYDVPV